MGSGFWNLTCGLAMTKIPQNMFFLQWWKVWKIERHLYTSLTHTQSIWTGQDRVGASFRAHLLEGKSGLEAVIWHQHCKSDTIYHRPVNMETFITSWQENLVENNHLGFDNNLAPSLALHLDSVLLGFAILCDLYSFIVHSASHHINESFNDFKF